MDEWPGRVKAQSLRQWPTLEATLRRAADVDAIDGVIILGSFASGVADEFSDLDLVAVTVPGRFDQAWAARDHLAEDVLVSWEERHGDTSLARWFKWLTRDLVKVECGIVDATSGERALAEPFVVVLGDPSVADRFPRISRADLETQRALVREQQRDFDPEAMTPFERLEWKIAEMRDAARAATGTARALGGRSIAGGEPSHERSREERRCERERERADEEGSAVEQKGQR